MRFVASVASRGAAAGAVVVLALALPPQTAAQSPAEPSPQIRFESRVDLVNVMVTVSDESGRFVPGLRKEDFALFEDGRPQPIVLFFGERVPVSLGIAIDTSDSMRGEKFDVARGALDRFLGRLLDPADEIFLCRFDDEVQVLQRWTTSRDVLRQALGRASPRGATRLYDAVAEAAPLAQTGRQRKKALIVISDGHDTSSVITVPELKQVVRDTEVLVYAIGIDGKSEPPRIQIPRLPFPNPLPIPGPGGRSPFPPGRGPIPPQPPRGPSPSPTPSRADARVDGEALRELTDDSGGRTEIVRSVYDLELSTAGVADELRRQYYLGYQSTSAVDGKWHSIRVEVPGRGVQVRARSGFTASSPSEGVKRHPCP